MSDVTDAIAVAASLASLAIAVYGVGYKFGQMEVKVNTMWDFVIRRAMVEGVDKGVGKLGSFEIGAANIDAAVKAHPEFVKDILAFYEKHKKLDDRELFIALEREFGNRMVTEVCLKYGYQLGACIIGALALCRESEGKKVKFPTQG